MLWRFRRTKRFIDSYSTSRDSWSKASPLFFNHPLPAVVTEGFDVEHNGDDQEGKESDHVCPDVPGLCVNSEDRLEALGGRLEFGSMALVKVLVVFHPLGKHVIRTCPPPMSIVRCMYLSD